MYVFVQYVKGYYLEATKYSKSKHHHAARTYFMKMCRTGVKEVKMNAFQCVNFVSCGSLKNS